MMVMIHDIFKTASINKRLNQDSLIMTIYAWLQHMTLNAFHYWITNSHYLNMTLLNTIYEVTHANESCLIWITNVLFHVHFSLKIKSKKSVHFSLKIKSEKSEHILYISSTEWFITKNQIKAHYLKLCYSLSNHFLVNK